eukprot:gene11860-13093_t
MSTNATPANYICYYAQDHLDFRLQELISIKQCVNLRYNDPYYSEVHFTKPFLPIILDKESDGQKMLERTVLMRYIIESWACACTIEEILDQKSSIDACAKKIFVNPNVTFRIDVEGFNKKLSMDCKMSWIKKLEKVLQFQGKVKMKDPDIVLCLLLDFRLSDEKEKTCQYIYFGRLVKNGSFVFDPFVGTGSMVCCAHFGAYTAGSDIDRTIIYGRGRSLRSGTKHETSFVVVVVNKMNAAVLVLLSILAVASATKFDRRPVRSEEEVDKIKSDAFTGTAITGNVWEVIWTISNQYVVNKMNVAVLLLLSILAVASATKFDRRPVRSEEEVDKIKSDAFTALNKLFVGKRKRDVVVPTFPSCNGKSTSSCARWKLAAGCQYAEVNKMNAAVLLLLSIVAVASATKFDRRPVRSEEEVGKIKSDAFTALNKLSVGKRKRDVLVDEFHACNEKSTSVIASCRGQLAGRCQYADVYCRSNGNNWKCLGSDLDNKQPKCCDFYCL